MPSIKLRTTHMLKDANAFIVFSKKLQGVLAVIADGVFNLPLGLEVVPQHLDEEHLCEIQLLAMLQSLVSQQPGNAF